MNNYHKSPLPAALACAFLFLLAAMPEVAAQVTAPPGSYKQTCSDIKMEGSTLRANCQDKGKTTGEKIVDALPGGGQEFKAGTTPLEKFHECDGNIGNNDGQLTCTRNPNHPRLKQAKSSIDHAIGNMLGKKASGGHVYDYWLGEMFASGLLPRFYAGMTNDDAMAFFQKFLAKPDQGNRRLAVINDAFKDVYSFEASPKDVAFWNAEMLAGRGGHHYITFVERSKLNADKVIRRLMIQAAYKKAMGRNPTPADFDYWQPRQEIFAEIVDAARAYLYSPGGAKDLAETVERALENRTGNKPTTQQISDAVIQYSKTRFIFDQM